MTIKKTLLLGLAGLAVSAVSACGASTTASRAPGQVSSPANGASSAPNPAATESNPPGDIPDNQAYVAFTPPGSTVSVKVPEGWARSTTPTSTVFTDKLNHIEIQISNATTPPTPSSVTSVDVPRLQGAVAKFAAPKVVTTTRSAGPVILLTYQGDSAVDPVTGKVAREAFERYTYFKAGTRVDLTLSGPTNADNVDPWRIVSDSLRWTP